MAEYQNYEEIPTEDEYDRNRLADFVPPVKTGLWIDKELMRLREDARVSYPETSGFVGKFTEMDPEHEDMLFDGSGLEVGMIVLAGIDMRQDVSVRLNPAEFHHARKYNRWFEIIQMTKNPSSVRILAGYEDGTKHIIELSPGHGWVYKRTPAKGVAEVPGQTSVFGENEVEKELKRLRKEDFGD